MTKEHIDVLEVKHTDDLQVIHRPDKNIWTPEGPVATEQQANAVLDDFRAFVGKATKIR